MDKQGLAAYLGLVRTTACTLNSLQVVRHGLLRVNGFLPHCPTKAMSAACHNKSLLESIPIDWPEPLGLVMIEAMACGTSSVGIQERLRARDASTGITGHIVDSLAGAIGNIGRTLSVKRRFPERYTAARVT
jgi:hypothetical protein